MKRITLVGIASHTERILDRLREVGVLHLSHARVPEGPGIEALADRVFLYNSALQVLGDAPSESREPDNVAEAVDSIIFTAERLDKCEEALFGLEQQSQKVAFLGSFEPEDVHLLEQKGISIRLYELRPNRLTTIPGSVAYRVLGRSSNHTIVIAVVSRSHDEDLPFTRIPIPEHSVSQLAPQIDRHRMECDRIRDELSGFGVYRAAITRERMLLQEKLDFEQARAGMAQEEELIYTRGFCPVDMVDTLRNAAQTNGWGLLIENPLPHEQPPTLVRTPRWVRIIRPVFSLLNTIPGYRELDVSLWFLLFFSVFFGMIIGDAGYGLLFLAATAFIQNRLGKRVAGHRDLFHLLYVLSATTILWGAVTGNWFGIEALTRIDPFRQLIIPGLNAYTLEAQNRIMSICFYIAAIHLSLAHLLVMFKEPRITGSLANAGWILMVWVMFFIAQNQVMDQPLPVFFPWLFTGAAVMIAVFTLIDKVPGKGLAEKLIADIILATINTFADTISYIRLFAVGLATLAVAQSFNEIALQVGFTSVIAGLGSALILIVGHSLNIALAAMAVIVHGVRLNMLEFSGHVGNTWSGYTYAPFKRRNSGLE